MRSMPLVALMLAAGAAQAEDWLYLTTPGDTLIRIGQQYLKNPNDWSKLRILNRVPDPKALPANTRLRIPVELLKITPAPVLVTHVEGNVRARAEGGAFRPLAVGDRLSSGETVLTGPLSFAGFKLADGSTLSQQPSSRLVFGRLAAYGKTGMVTTELNLQSGRLEASASRQVAPAGGFKVVTPVAVAGLRGTEFRLNVDEAGKSLKSEVLEGAVGVAAADREVVVAERQGTVAEAGQPPQEPRPLLPAPSAHGLPDKVIDLPLRFAWQGTAGAKAWRSQIAADAQFRKIYLENLTDTPETEWRTHLPDGHYVLRLRAIDAAGLEGVNLDHPMELDARPLPPAMTSPEEGMRHYQETVAFSWLAPEEANGYLLQISPSRAFPAAQTTERKLDAAPRHSETLPAGGYYWRMASLDDKGMAHGWSAPRHFRVQPLPVAPKGEASADNGKAGFNWQAVSGAERYEFQLNTQQDFASPVAQQTLAATSVGLDLKPGRYFWRVRGLEAGGQAGAWSGTSRLVMPPEPPMLTQAVHDVGKLHLAWKGDAAIYRLELAADKTFKDIVVKQDTTQTALVLPVRLGKYWLRITGIDAEGKVGTPTPGFELNVQEGSPYWWYADKIR